LSLSLEEDIKNEFHGRKKRGIKEVIEMSGERKENVTGICEPVNIGSEESPVLVSEKALRPLTPEGREWWAMVATGSVVLKPEVLDKLLQATDAKTS